MNYNNARSAGPPSSSIPRLIASSSTTSLALSTTSLSSRDFIDSRANADFFTTPLSSGHRRLQTTTATSSSMTGTANRNEAKGIFCKNWQSNQILRVCNFLEICQDDTETLRQALLQKQLTITSFIGISNILLIETKIFEASSRLTSANYVEKLPQLLKKIQYRGQISRSLMSTVNTSHSLPHVISMFSYLLDLYESSSSADAFETHFLSCDPEVRRRQLLIETAISKSQNSLLDAGCGDGNEDIAASATLMPASGDQLFDQFLLDRKIDPTETTRLKAEIEQLTLDLKDAEYEKMRRNVQASTVELETLEKDKAMLFAEIRKMRSVMKENEAQIDHLKRKSNNECEEINMLKEKLSETESVLMKSAFTKKDLSSLKAEIAELAAILEKKREKLVHLQSLSEADDFKITHMRCELQDQISDYNKSLLEPCIARPELKTLLLPENGVNYVKLKESLNIVQDELQHLKKQSQADDDNRRRQKTEEKELMRKQIESKNIELNELLEKCTNFELEMERVHEEFLDYENKHAQCIREKEMEVEMGLRHSEIVRELLTITETNNERADCLLQLLDKWRKQKTQFKAVALADCKNFQEMMSKRRSLVESDVIAHFEQIRLQLTTAASSGAPIINQTYHSKSIR